MLGLGSIPYSIAVFLGIYEWLDDEEPRRYRRRRPHRPLDGRAAM